MYNIKQEFYVEYVIPLVTGDKIHRAGPYASYEEAGNQMRDIEGYEGVKILGCKTVG